jgi:DNA-directed RNA polymerase specialized sigma24 family protein
LLHALKDLSRDELLARAQIRARDDAGYIPTECLVYFVRASRADNSDAWFERLYKILSARVLRALPTADAADGASRSLTRERIREKVYGRFVEMMAGDRQAYDERLDFFEIRFDMALKRLRQDAQRQAWRDENRFQPLSYEDDSGELSPEIEEAAGRANPLEGLEIDNEAFRLRLDAAIETLPPEQSRTIQMLMLGYQIHSEDPDVITICTALKKSPKTIWNYRDRAIKTLRRVLIEGDDQ